VSASEQVLNGTPAQLGYTVPFMSVHSEKYEKYATEDKSRTDTTKTKDNEKRANNTKHSRNKTSLV